MKPACFVFVLVSMCWLSACDASSTAGAPQAAIPSSAAAAARPTSDGISLCLSNESVLLSCKIKGNGKLASLCASKGISDRTGYVYYAYGSPGHSEFEFPTDKSPPAKRFKRTHLTFAGATSGVAYSFKNGGWEYIFYSISGTQLENQGVAVKRIESLKAEKQLPCDQESVIRTDDEALLKFVRTWDQDVELSQHGLPLP